MPTDKEKDCDRAVPLELDTQNKAQGPVVDEKAPSWSESTLIAETNAGAQFRFRILVVDDDPSMREVARAILESGGYEVLTAADGLEGLHALSTSLPDLVISDLNMPRMSGFEFLAVIRERFPHIATIAIAGEYITVGNPCGILADAFLALSLAEMSKKPSAIGRGKCNR